MSRSVPPTLAHAHRWMCAPDRATIWRLREALDAKDDMLGFMDAKLSYYEDVLGRHGTSKAGRPQQMEQQQLAHHGTRR